MERRYYNRQIETMVRDELLQYQWKLLKKQVEYTYAKSGLCKLQFAAAKITPDDIKTREDFINKVPFTTKQDLLADQRENPPYGTRLAIPENEIHITYLTSGTSGKGQEVHTFTREDWEAFLENSFMMYTWMGWKKGDRVMNPVPSSTAIGGFAHSQSMQRFGLNAFNLGMYDTKTRLDYMRRFEITGIFVGASYLENITAEIEKLGLDPARDFSVRSIFMVGQAYPISFVQKMEEKWKAKIYDYYGTTQLAVGCTCENGAVVDNKRGYYHLYNHRVFHEVINPETLQPVGAGEEGEVVVTPLYKKASPFLRFRQADKARFFPHDTCDCGRPFDLLEAGTIARYDDMMKIKGVNVWPAAIDEVILTKEGPAEYKGRVFMSNDKKEKAEVAIEFKTGVPQDMKQRLMSQIEHELRDRIGIGFLVKETEQELPRYLVKTSSLRWTDERIKGLEKKSMGK